MPIVLIGPEPIRRLPGPYRDVLEAAGCTLIYPEGEGTMTAEQLRAMLPGVDAHMAGGEPLSRDILKLAPNLNVIARTGVGYDAVDIPASTELGIPVTITPGTNQGSVAEQAFGLLLGLTRDVVNNHETVKAGGWNRTLVAPLRGKTLGLVGLGRIGKAMAGRARAFEMRVVAFDVTPDDGSAAAMGVERVEFVDLLRQSDVVSLHAPLIDSTRNLFDRKVFGLMKPGSVLINTARGGLVVEADLADALKSGHLAGAGLDVFQSEPPEAGNPLVGLPNVIASPHIGGIDSKSMSDMAELAARCIVDVLEGRWPAECVVNREVEATRRR